MCIPNWIYIHVMCKNDHVLYNLAILYIYLYTDRWTDRCEDPTNISYGKKKIYLAPQQNDTFRPLFSGNTKTDIGLGLVLFSV